MHGPGAAGAHQHRADLRLGIVLSTSTVLPLQAAGGPSGTQASMQVSSCRLIVDRGCQQPQHPAKQAAAQPLPPHPSRHAPLPPMRLPEEAAQAASVPDGLHRLEGAQAAGLDQLHFDGLQRGRARLAGRSLHSTRASEVSSTASSLAGGGIKEVCQWRAST